jgi:alanine racemase
MLIWDQTPSLTPMRCCRAWIEIDLAALQHNVRQLKGQLAQSTELMAVVKADAYGHGAVTVASAVLQAGATWLGVATVPEGIELRQAGITAPILVMGAVNSLEEVRAIARWHLQPTLVSPKQALVFSDALSERRQPKAAPLPVHLKLDTGMSRLGFAWGQAVEFVQFVRRLPHLQITGLYSHFATADSVDQSTLRLQQQRFEQAVLALRAAQICPPQLHLANSAAALTDPALHHDMVRLGLALYGLYPAPHLRSRVSLQPVLQVKARITHLKAIAAGTGVSYGHQFVAPKAMRLAVVGIGYADGVPRTLSNRMQVLVKGQRVAQIGAITMDQLMLDVTDVPDLQEGDIATVLGQEDAQVITADDWAELAGTISWEILCSFKHRLPRIAQGSATLAAAPAVG